MNGISNSQDNPNQNNNPLDAARIAQLDMQSQLALLRENNFLPYEVIRFDADSGKNITLMSDGVRSGLFNNRRGLVGFSISGYVQAFLFPSIFLCCGEEKEANLKTHYAIVECTIPSAPPKYLLFCVQEDGVTLLGNVFNNREEAMAEAKSNFEMGALNKRTALALLSILEANLH